MNTTPLKVADLQRIDTTPACEAALQGLYEICTGRLAYFQKMLEALSQSDSSEIIIDFINLQKRWEREDETQSLNLSEIEQTKVELINKTKKTCQQYQDILDEINMNKHTQSLVDDRYFSLRIEYFIHQSNVARFQKEFLKKGKLSKRKNKLPSKPQVGGADLWHTTFFQESLELLEPVISAGEKDFWRDCELLDSETHQYNLQLESNRNFDKSWQKLCDFLPYFLSLTQKALSQKAIAPIIEEYNVLKGRMWEFKLTVEGGNIDAGQKRKIYHGVCELIDKFGALKKRAMAIELAQNNIPPVSELTQEKETLKTKKGRRGGSQKTVPPGKRQEEIKSKEETQGISVPATQRLSTPTGQLQNVSLATTIAALGTLQPNVAALVVADSNQDYRRLKDEEWKATVARRRQEKEQQVLEERKQKNEGVQRDRAASFVALERLVRVKMHIAFLLLQALNPRHLATLSEIHSLPTPHLQIPYQDIVSLFSGEADSLGELIEESGGSHKKIVIKGTLGYFNRPRSQNKSKGASSEEELKLVRESVTGGTFKPHRLGSSSEDKMPRTAVEMIRDTLDRADITRHHLDLFLDVKQRLATQPGLSPTIDQMLDIAENIQARLFFCSGIMKPESLTRPKVTSSLLHLQVDPDPGNRFGEEEQQAVLTEIFSFLPSNALR